MATLNQMDPVVEPDTPSLHQSSSHDNGVEGIASSSASEPPEYSRNAPLEDPFRDDSNSNGMRKGLKPATTTDAAPALPKTAMLIEAPPAVPIDMVLGEGLPPPLPYQRCCLSRGLQIPSRFSLITWGFSFPKVLPEQGVSREQWQLFKHELERFAYLTISQELIIIGCGFLVSHFLGIIPGSVLGWKMRKHREHENFFQAYQGGAFKTFEDRWNNTYFHTLGLHVRVVPPGIGRMDGMDVASSKLYKYQQKMGISSPAPGVGSQGGDKKEYRYQFKEGRYRMKATGKGRIIVLPYLLPAQTRITGSESYRGQAKGVTSAKAATSTHDFIPLNRGQSSAH